MIYSKLRRTNIQNAAGTPVTPRILHIQEPDKLKIVDSSQFQLEMFSMQNLQWNLSERAVVLSRYENASSVYQQDDN